MKNLNTIAEDLFNKIRGRFSAVTLGTEDGKVTEDPEAARFYDFAYKVDDRTIGKVSVSLDEDKLSVMYANNFVEQEEDSVRESWYDFLRELRTFAKKRLLQFDTRNITKSNLDRRDYQFLSKNRNTTMSESRLWGTGRVSYQNIGSARLNIRHRSSINQEQAAARTRNIDKIFIESPEGERFRYPYRHLAGARAMARHVAEGGTPFDDFGKHVIGLSEELNNLKKFKTYVNRSAVMAEGLSQYMDVIEGRAKDVKRELETIQKSNGYANIIENYETVVLEEVPDDVKTNWIDELTIRQFNEDLKDIFPYIYRLVGEAKQAKELGPEELEEELSLGDDVHIKSKNKTGMYYGEKDGEIIVKTPAGVETADPEDVEQVDSEAQEEKETELPVTEFILSHYDRETGSWPRGETAVLTGVEKDYGESFIEPAKQFIDQVNQTFEQYNTDTQLTSEGIDSEDLVRSIFARMEKRQTLKRLFNQYNNDQIVSAIRDVADMHAGAEELGSSDISAMVDQVYKQLDGLEEGCGCDDDAEEPDTDDDFERLRNLAGL